MVYNPHLKRLLDVLLALLLVVATLPFQVFIAVLLAIRLGWGHVLYARHRIGQGELPFLMFKFTTLLPVPAHLEADAGVSRQFAIGNWLRRTTLDELPQLYHILAGQMSFIGPRPLLPEYLPYYSEQEKRRHLVKPGITGLAQVKGGNGCSWDERLQWDVDYVDRLSWQLDWQIILLSISYLWNSRRKQEPLVPERLDVVRRIAD